MNVDRLVITFYNFIRALFIRKFNSIENRNKFLDFVSVLNTTFMEIITKISTHIPGWSMINYCYQTSQICYMIRFNRIWYCPKNVCFYSIGSWFISLYCVIKLYKKITQKNKILERETSIICLICCCRSEKHCWSRDWILNLFLLHSWKMFWCKEFETNNRSEEVVISIIYVI